MLLCLQALRKLGSDLKHLISYLGRYCRNMDLEVTVRGNVDLGYESQTQSVKERKKRKINQGGKINIIEWCWNENCTNKLSFFIPP